MDDMKTFDEKELAEDENVFNAYEEEKVLDDEKLGDEELDVEEEFEDEVEEEETEEVAEEVAEEETINLDDLAADIATDEDEIEAVYNDSTPSAPHFNNNTEFLRKFAESFSDKFVLVPNENINYKAKKREQDAKRAVLVEKLEIKYKLDKKY